MTGMNAELVKKKRVRTGQRCHLEKMCTTADNILKEYNPSLESELFIVNKSNKRMLCKKSCNH